MASTLLRSRRGRTGRIAGLPAGSPPAPGACPAPRDRGSEHACDQRNRRCRERRDEAAGGQVAPAPPAEMPIAVNAAVPGAAPTCVAEPASPAASPAWASGTASAITMVVGVKLNATPWRVPAPGPPGGAHPVRGTRAGPWVGRTSCPHPKSILPSLARPRPVDSLSFQSHVPARDGSLGEEGLGIAATGVAVRDAVRRDVCGRQRVRGLTGQSSPAPRRAREQSRSASSRTDAEGPG